MQKNILFVNHTAKLGGAEISLLTLIERLDRNKYAPHVALPEDDGEFCRQLKAAGVTLHCVAMKRFHRTKNPFKLLGYIFSWRRAIKKITKIIRDNHIGLVHSNSTTSHLFASPAAERTHTPVIWHIRDYTVPSDIFNTLVKKATAIVAVSESTLRTIRGEARRKTRVIHNGVDTAKFSPRDASAFRASLGIPADAPVVGMMAQFAPWKGHRRFIDAAALVAKVNPTAHYVIAGEDMFGDFPELMQDLKQYASALELSSKIHFVGWAGDAPSFFNSLNVLAVPSNAEPFGRVIIEAMACAKPVVAFNIAGPVEIIDDGKTGFLVEPHSVEDMAEKIAKLLSDKSATESMGAAGRAAACERFSAERYAAKIQELYAELLNR